MNGSSQLAKYEVIKMKHHQVNEKKLEKKKLPMASDAFEKIDYIDEAGVAHQKQSVEEKK